MLRDECDAAIRSTAVRVATPDNDGPCATIKANMLPLLRHFWVTLKHKVFVLRAGRRTRAPVYQLLIHDWSKFTPAEAPHYARHFFGDKGDPAGFDRAWRHHQSVNPHHWQYWIPRDGHVAEIGEPLPMPERFVREMVADWLGASRAYAGAWPKSRDDWTWLAQSLPQQRLHPDTRILVEKVLAEIFPAR